MIPSGYLDSPVADALVYQHGFNAEGWASTRSGRPWKKVRLYTGDDVIGETSLPFSRPDVAADYGPSMDKVGFALYCTINEALRDRDSIEIHCRAEYADGPGESFGARTLRLSQLDYRQHGHGHLMFDGPKDVLRREHVYGSGPPAYNSEPSIVELIMRYVKPGDSVLDVGCGIGAYARALQPLGVAWTGCEARADYVQTMLEGGLNAVHVTGALPFANDTFDAAICIEVLEHVDEYHAFLAEIARVVRGKAVFSVPNFAAIPITSAFYAVPWHLLEADHKNFFTTQSLRTVLAQHFEHVETFEYGPLSLMKSLDGLAINNHVFAVAGRADVV